jgi:hypothetical protein
MIIYGGKNVENRDWPTTVRGRILIHAAKTMTPTEWTHAWDLAQGAGAGLKGMEAGVTRENIQRGGIIGSVEIYDCVTTSCSEWFIGSYGFLLRKPRPLPFTPWRGQLGFFDVPVGGLPAETREALLEVS